MTKIKKINSKYLDHSDLFFSSKQHFSSKGGAVGQKKETKKKASDVVKIALWGPHKALFFFFKSQERYSEGAGKEAWGVFLLTEIIDASCKTLFALVRFNCG